MEFDSAEKEERDEASSGNGECQRSSSRPLAKLAPLVPPWYRPLVLELRLPLAELALRDAEKVRLPPPPLPLWMPCSPMGPTAARA